MQVIEDCTTSSLVGNALGMLAADTNRPTYNNAHSLNYVPSMYPACCGHCKQTQEQVMYLNQQVAYLEQTVQMVSGSDHVGSNLLIKFSSLHV